MKTCDYCGRESQDEAACCQECGTAFAEADRKPADTTDWAWVAGGFKWVSVVCAIACLYLLSLGPVMRFCGTVTTTQIPPPPVTVTSRTGTTATLATARTVQSIRFPRMITWVYYPAMLSLASSDPPGSFNEIYRRYLDWWMKSLVDASK